jgi:putative spermidine/putrescine transport system permease protein
MSATTRGDRLAMAAAALVAAPVLLGIAYSVAASLGLAGAGAHDRVGAVPLVAMLGDPVLWRGLAFTLWSAALATSGSLVLAVAIAVCFRGATRTDRAARALAALPLAVPHLVAGALGLWILGQSGMLSRLAGGAGLIRTPVAMPALVYDRYGLGLAITMAWKELGFLTIAASALLATRGVHLEDVSRTLGASPMATFRRVTWPVLWRGLMPAVVAVFVFVAGSYEVAALLAPSDPPALPLLVAERAADPDLARHGDAYVVSLVLLLIGVLAVAAHEWTRARWESLAE